jgi:aryl-alcohol dehydrogenase-like predicted oxidoreductase
LDQTGLWVSQAGFGCYRVDDGVATHEKALRKALFGGVNLIDTSSNYGDGGSEKLVGAVLEDLFSSRRLARESIVVTSKVGYLQGQNYQLSQERKRQGHPFKELVLYAEGLEHCIHPEFLHDQLSRSLERLQLNTLDVYLLHNPEYYLSWADKTGLPLDEAGEKYYDRIRRAFSHLETEVERGRIRFYGISSNTFPSPAADPDFTSLQKVWQIAESLSERHHFRIIQLPMNLLETGAANEKNQAGGQSAIQFARDHHLGVFINRPLNAVLANRLVRLAGVQATQAAGAEEVSAAIEELSRSEDFFKQRILPGLNLTPSLQAQVIEQISLGGILKQHWPSFGTYWRWQELQSSYFSPRFLGLVRFLSQRKESTEEISAWIESHQEKLEETFLTVASTYQEAAAEKSARIRAKAASIDEDWAEATRLSQIALRALRSTVGITTVLVGMRQEAYVTDVLEELACPVKLTERTESWHRLGEISPSAL